TRVPFIVQWKQQIEPGVSDALVCQIDLLASLGSLLNIETEKSDSENILEAFLGKSAQGRTELVLEAQSRTALRQGDWVMIPPYNGPERSKNVDVELGNSPDYRLYNVKDDMSQKQNMAEIYP